MTVEVRTIQFVSCPACGRTDVVRLPDEWEGKGAIPIVGCGNPFHYAERTLGDAPEEAAA